VVRGSGGVAVSTPTDEQRLAVLASLDPDEINDSDTLWEPFAARRWLPILDALIEALAEIENLKHELLNEAEGEM